MRLRVMFIVFALVYNNHHETSAMAVTFIDPLFVRVPAEQPGVRHDAYFTHEEGAPAPDYARQLSVMISG